MFLIRHVGFETEVQFPLLPGAAALHCALASLKEVYFKVMPYSQHNANSICLSSHVFDNSSDSAAVC